MNVREWLIAWAIGSTVTTGAFGADRTSAFPFPSEYREWVYLSSGFDMSYSTNAQPPTAHAFDNVFVNPDAYRAFLKTGTWPDKTVLVLEIRNANGKGSINEHGFFQAADTRGVELHVKDKERFPKGWAFVGFNESGRGSLIPRTANCYSCHEQHGAVDTTFVQFYPTLLRVAKQKGTALER